ncbi:MAG: triose-phosphate isomerase [Rhizobiales bacterium]|nr:triose-phosphate isomerase [Hyphomicrobiales bacterium]
MAIRGPRPLVAGNWKMNGTTASLKEARLIAGMLKDVRLRCDVMICPPATLLRRLKGVLAGTPIKLGGQNCHWDASGAFTGEISAEMLKDAGCSAVIVGHSERRSGFGETDAVVRSKADAAHRAGIAAIICIGETLEQRKAGQAVDVVSRQLRESLPDGSASANTVIAYEPVWAIGTGLTPTPDEVGDIHSSIRGGLVAQLGEDGSQVRILYGGSVKPSNAPAFAAIPDVNGALVGGASLKAVDFIGIIKAYI